MSSATLPHPQALLSRQLARNRWRVRRVLWPQTLVFGATLAGLGVAALVLIHQRSAPLLSALLNTVQDNPGAMVLGLVLLVAAHIRSYLHEQERLFRQGPFAVLPVTAASRRVWLNGLAFRYTTAWLSGLGVLLGLIAAVTGQMRPVSGLAPLILLAVLGGGWVGRLLAERRAAPVSESPRSERVPMHAWRFLSRSDLPHVPAWMAQWAGSRWISGRAPAGLMVLLLIAPNEAAAVLVPIVGMAAWLWLNRIDLTHRGVCALHELLGVSSPSGQRLVRALWPVSMMFSALLLLWLGVVLYLAGLPPSALLALILVVPGWVLIDLLLAVRCRRSVSEQGRSRLLLSTSILCALTQAPPLLLLLLPIGWWWWRSLRS